MKNLASISLHRKTFPQAGILGRIRLIFTVPSSGLFHMRLNNIGSGTLEHSKFLVLRNSECESNHIIIPLGDFSISATKLSLTKVSATAG